MIKVSYWLAAAFALVAVLYNPLSWLPAIFCLVLGLGLSIQQRLTPDETPEPLPPRKSLTEWNPANTARRGDSKAERRRRVEGLAQDKDATWGKWSRGE